MITPPTKHQRRILSDIAAGMPLDAAGWRFGYSSKTGLAMSRASLLRRGWIDDDGRITESGKKAIQKS